MDKVPIIIGPTAIGKTSYGITLAKEIGAEIISADSMQVYKYMDIGTAKPSVEERQDIPHHLIDIIGPGQEWTLHSFLEQVRPLLASDRKFIIVGGTGLYIRALIYNFNMPKLEINSSLRKELKKQLSKEGLVQMYNRLNKVDSQAAKGIHENDEYRILRALEVYETLGEPISKHQKMDTDYAKKFQLTCLSTDREIVYANINSRVDKMFELGLVDEVMDLMTRGYSSDLPSMQALGYKEVFSFLQGEITLAACQELIKKRTRNFAKRQLTWYRSFPDVEWLDTKKMQ